MNGDGTPAAIDITNNLDAMYLAISDADNIARAASADVTMSVSKKGNSSITLEIGPTLDSATYETSNGVASAIHALTSDVITLTVGNQTVTGLVGKDPTTATSLGKVIRALWNTAEQASTEQFDWSVGAVASGSANANGLKMTFTSKDKGSAGFGVTPSISFASGTATRVNPIVVPTMLGATRSTGDNASTGTDILITLKLLQQVVY